MLSTSRAIPASLSLIPAEDVAAKQDQHHLALGVTDHRPRYAGVVAGVYGAFTNKKAPTIALIPDVCFAFLGVCFLG